MIFKSKASRVDMLNGVSRHLGTSARMQSKTGLITLDMSEHLQKVRDKRWHKISSVEGEITVNNKGISNESLLQAAEGHLRC